MERNEMIKSLLESSSSFEDADRIISEFTPCNGIREKLAYLYGMFNISIVGSSSDSENESDRILYDYQAVLTAIVNKKWR